MSLGAGLGSINVNDGKTVSLNQADRLKRFMEANDRTVGGYRAGGVARPGDAGKDDDDSRSISTSFASQVDIGSYD